MDFHFFKKEIFEQKMMSWASAGLLIFVSAFFWAPSRDGLQGVYYLAFFVPMLLVLLSRKPTFIDYGGWLTVSALLYAGFSALSALWSSEPKGVIFFAFQWLVLATWLCGTSLLFTKRDIDIEKYMNYFVIVGALISATIVIHYYYGFFISKTKFDRRLFGWNVFRNPNEIGAMCGVVALLAFTAAMRSIELKKVYFFYFLMVISVVGLIFSFSRGSLIAFVCMALVALFFIRPSVKIWLPPILVSTVMLCIFLVSDTLDSHLGRSHAFDGRVTIWFDILERCKDNIFAGIGMTKNTNINITNTGIYNHAHNAWIDTLYRTGLIGLILAVAHLTTIGCTFSRNTKLLPLYLWLGYGCICSLFDSRCFFWEIGAKWFFYWIPIGLLVASLAAESIRHATSERE